MRQLLKAIFATLIIPLSVGALAGCMALALFFASSCQKSEGKVERQKVKEDYRMQRLEYDMSFGGPNYDVWRDKKTGTEIFCRRIVKGVSCVTLKRGNK